MGRGKNVNTDINPDKHDIDYLKELIDIRSELVENKWDEVFYPGNG